jgi:signal transduction histidine kinase
MTGNAMLLCDIRLSPSAAAALESARTPAWLIEPEEARIVAANGRGLELLALTRDGANATLDAAMPAVARLRALLSKPDQLRASAATGQKLVFWRPAGVVRLSCTVAPVDGSPLSLLLVTAETSGDGAGEAQAQSAKPPTDDAATLKEIARRIRAGRKVAAPVVEDISDTSSEVLPDVPDEDTRKPAPTQSSGRDDPHRLAKLAHELRTPVAAIAAAAEVMRDERLGALENTRYQGYAADIAASARHALSVIDRVLGGNSQPDAPGAVPPGEIDVNGLVKGLGSSLRALAKEAGVRLRVRLEAREGAIAADETSMRQIVLNLVTNAIKFTGAGGRVELATRRPRDGSVVVVVRDSGPGMSKQEIARALEATAAVAAGRRPKGGLGLGLPLVRALAEANGARLSIESTPGKGTVARVTFPKQAVIAKQRSSAL